MHADYPNKLQNGQKVVIFLNDIYFTNIYSYRLTTAASLHPIGFQEPSPCRIKPLKLLCSSFFFFPAARIEDSEETDMRLRKEAGNWLCHVLLFPVQFAD